MSEDPGEFERLLGHAALRLWSELPREVQEKLFETAVPLDPMVRNRLAIFLHDRHPRMAHPPKPLPSPLATESRRANCALSEALQLHTAIL